MPFMALLSTAVLSSLQGPTPEAQGRAIWDCLTREVAPSFEFPLVPQTLGQRAYGGIGSSDGV